MATHTTTIQPSTKGARTLIATTAFTLVALAGAVLWLVRPGGDEAAPPAAIAPAARATGEGAVPLGGPATTAGARATLYITADPVRAEALRRTIDDERRHDTYVVVAAPDETGAEYARYVERLRALDGSTPLAVTVVIVERPAAARPGTTGMAQLYPEEPTPAARVTTTGMAELDGEPAPITATAAATTLGGLAELYGEQRAAATMARGGTSSDCGATVGPAAC